MPQFLSDGSKANLSRINKKKFFIVKLQADVIKPDLGEHDFAVILRLGELHVLHILEPVVQVQPPQQVVT